MEMIKEKSLNPKKFYSLTTEEIERFISPHDHIFPEYQKYVGEKMGEEVGFNPKIPSLSDDLKEFHVSLARKLEEMSKNSTKQTNTREENGVDEDDDY